jgi:hypothetical protein
VIAPGGDNSPPGTRPLQLNIPQYVLVEDKLVIVDRHSKRVVAMAPSVD